MKKLKDINLRKYTPEQLTAINEVFSELAEFQAKQPKSQVPSVAAFDAEQLELDTLVQLNDAERQAKDYAARRNAGKRSEQGDDTLKEGIFDWIKRTGRGRRNH